MRQENHVRRRNVHCSRLAKVLLTLWLTTAANQAFAQNERFDKYSPEEFSSLIPKCAPNAAVSTMLAIARTESALHPFAISLNSPKTLAKHAGYTNARIDLARGPESPTEARQWAQWFRTHGMTTSLGIMQVNVEVAQLYGITDNQLFDPCVNIHVAALILGDAYANAARQYGDSPHALAVAISAYNTGNWRNGLSNGYVRQVYKNGRR